jgi:hypothetical protein
MEAHGADMVLWNYRKVFQDHAGPPYLPIRAEVIDLPALGLANYFYRYWFPYVHGQEVWSRLYRRDVMAANGLAFVSGAEVFAEDSMFAAMYLLHARKLVALEGAYVYYRQRGNSLMSGHKPGYAGQLVTLALRFAAYARDTGRERELRHVLPMLLYRLSTKGLAGDPSAEDAAFVLTETVKDARLRGLLRSLLWGAALPVYLFRTGKGLRTQIRARAFALAWLCGRKKMALRLAGRRERSRR